MKALSLSMSCNCSSCEPADQATLNLAVARRVVNRSPADPVSSECPPRAGERLYAHTTLAGFGQGFLEHVWRRDGVEVARHYLPVSSQRRWRGWTSHRLESGTYSIEIIAPQGGRIACVNFQVEPRGCKAVPVSVR